MNLSVIKFLQVVLLIFAVLCLAISVFAVYKYFFDALPTKEGFVTVTGEVEKFEKKTSEASGNEYLDIYLKDHPLRFRVGIGGYETRFKSELFYSTVQTGSKIYIEVKKNALENPMTPRGDPAKTVFIETLADDSNKYIDWVDFINWYQNDRKWVLVIGIVFFAAGALLTVLSIFYLPRFEAGQLKSH